MAELEIKAPPSGGEPPAAAPGPSPQEPPPERPAWLPEGMNSPEDLAAAYEQLKDRQTPQPGDENAPPAADDKAVAKFVQDTGFDPMELSREIATTGDINDTAKAALARQLEKVGLPASMVDEYISGQKAVQDKAVQEIMAVAGGEEGWQEMAAWAQQSLSDAEIAAFNNIVLKADVNTAKLTIGNLYARFKASAPHSGSRLKGSSGANAGDIFQSWEQQLAAQKDPRYAADSAFRAEVERKIERTLKAGGYHHSTR